MVKLTTTSGIPFAAPTGFTALVAIQAGAAAGINPSPMPPDEWGKPSYVAPNRGNILVLVSTISISFAAVFVVIRLWFRLRAGWAMDDWVMIPAWIFAAGCMVNSVWGVKKGGVGKHAYDLSYDELGNALWAFYLHLLFYIPGSSFAKLSVVFFVKRLAGATASRTMNWLVYGNGFFIVVYNIILFFLQIFSCAPVKAAVSLPLRFHPKTTCMNYLPIYYAGSVCHTISDCLLLAAPIHLVLGLQMGKRNKIVVIGMLALGGLAIICTVIRMAYILNYTRGTDLSWDAINASIWGHLEMAFAIIAGCAPSLRPMFSRFLPAALTGSSKNTPDNNRTSGWTVGKIPSKLSGHGASANKSKAEVSWHSVSRWSAIETRKDVKHGWEIGRGSQTQLVDDIEMQKTASSREARSRGSEEAVSAERVMGNVPPPPTAAMGGIMKTMSVNVRYETDDEEERRYGRR